MIACPNCGGNTKFDIPSQQVSCEFCNSLFDPYMFDTKNADAVENTQFEVTIFTCPQCGGEILSTDDAAAGFCSFCGASTILFSRISKEKRPGYIIPFKKTKEDCKKSYSSMMKKAFFAPKELKNPQYIDGFRGIYMPYWAYHLTQQGGFTFKGKKSHRQGDYIITDHFNLIGNIDAYYKGISYDASAAFSDDISQALAPFDVKGMKSFTPAYLSGFYADVSNVDAETYLPEAEEIALREASTTIRKHPDYRGYELSGSDISANKLHTRVKEIDSTMFPVWFMSYRNGDRVAYATVNGQTGKVVADLPVDISKYLIGSLGLAIPLFFILDLFFTLTPNTFLYMVIALSIITAITFVAELSAISKKENYADDKGVQYKQSHSKNTQESDTSTKSESNSVSVKKTGLYALVVAIVIAFGIAFLHPIHDINYYIGAVICLAAESWTLIETIKGYNILATRRLPQFDKEGGDNRA